MNLFQRKQKKDEISDRPDILISFIQWVDRTIKHVNHSLTVAQKTLTVTTLPSRSCSLAF